MNRPLFSLPSAFRRPSSRPEPREIVLRSNEHWKLSRPAAEESIRCVRGAVWITCEGQHEDVVLTAGHQWQPPVAGVTVIGALSDAVLSVGSAPLQEAA